MSKYYILKGKEAVEADVNEWALWFETARASGERIVNKTTVGEVEISTVFLGLDHSFGEGPPLIFETLVFEGSYDGDMERYSTWDEAEKGHQRMVDLVKGEGE